MKQQSIQTIGIIGLGLIGASIGMALRKSDPALLIKGLTRSKINAKHALAKGAIHRLVPGMSELLDKTDLVILATPVRAIVSLLPQIGARSRCPVIVTDTGSTKREICAAGQRLPPHIAFIGGHPLAGKEVNGAVHADSQLFSGKPWVLTSTRRRDSVALSVVRALIIQIGAKPLELTPADHDRLLGEVSHLPFVISALLMETVRTHPDWPEAQTLAGSGFRDATRLAVGGPVMHTDILRTNRREALSELSRFEREIRKFRKDLASRRWTAIENRLHAIQKARRDWGKEYL
jgi:prephenate dehydrogenase